eukprot:Cvel_28870.t1-p1 / transcript=Cvel_28870.t1 / gene=Cvel_28870 / organism=Chromera_velia_CCMP2878 / gene_product=hypothetical protein / transcript_product=hypothetical protein / location=Cvel_scaffold3857:327-3193(-) / protein_length=117 / sequence_SO=supercontig / SO=protein_coding / is_pseudo=false
MTGLSDRRRWTETDSDGRRRLSPSLYKLQRKAGQNTIFILALVSAPEPPVMAEDILRNGWGRRFGGNLIGGEDEEVEMDEMKMGACKDGKGHPVEGVWVLVAVCRRTGRFVAEPVRC